MIKKILFGLCIFSFRALQAMSRPEFSPRTREVIKNLSYPEDIEPILRSLSPFSAESYRAGYKANRERIEKLTELMSHKDAHIADLEARIYKPRAVPAQEHYEAAIKKLTHGDTSGLSPRSRQIDEPLTDAKPDDIAVIRRFFAEKSCRAQGLPTTLAYIAAAQHVIGLNAEAAGQPPLKKISTPIYDLNDVDWKKETSTIPDIKPESDLNPIQHIIEAGVPRKLQEINHLRAKVNRLHPEKPPLPMLAYSMWGEYDLAMSQAVSGKSYSKEENAQLVLSPKLAEIKRLQRLIPEQEKPSQALQQRNADLAYRIAELEISAQKVEEEHEKELDVRWHSLQAVQRIAYVQEQRLAQFVQSRERLKNCLALLPPSYTCSTLLESNLIDLLKDELAEFEALLKK